MANAKSTGPIAVPAAEGWFPQLLVECIGTLALTFVAVAATVGTWGSNGPNVVAVALAYGLAVGLMVAATGHISGGAFNPAVTIGFFVARKLSALQALAYLLAQIVGGLLGAWAITTVFPSSMINLANFGLPAIGNGFSNGNAFVAEILATFFLMYVIFGTAIDARGPASIAGLCIGAAVAMDVFAVSAISGAAMNPARWLGPAVILGNFDNWPIWVLGPLAGAVLATVVYYYIYLRVYLRRR